jgi:predicted signal transduction protein with EAL and GGDEF domain
MAAAIGEREREITHLALHDSETGLPNRFSLERAIEALRTEVRAEGGVVVVAALGIDRFHFVRGAIGYHLAARLVEIVGQRLAALAFGGGVARLSSDVLALAYRAADIDAAYATAADLAEALDAPVLLEGERIDVSLTVGLSVCGVADAVVASPIERASIALDQARAAHRKAAHFDETAYGDPSTNLSLISELREGVARGDLKIHHQPKYDLREGRVTAVEALARWKHPVRGMIPPDLFIGMAEETGHIMALTESVLAQAIADQAALRRAGHDLTVSVNISGRLMDDADFATGALEMIKAAGADICFEITETAVIDNPELALSIIDRLVKAGVGISIDDYGSGLSSLSYLKQIRATELKIDKTFITALSESHRDALLVKSTIDLAHGLGLKVVAEGVETADTLALLTGMGCDIAQGYLIARPMPLEDLLAFLGPSAAREESA